MLNVHRPAYSGQPTNNLVAIVSSREELQWPYFFKAADNRLQA
jgi:hypothetical protein